MSSPSASKTDTLEVFAHLKSQILSNARFSHGGSKNTNPRTYDIITSTKNKQYRASLVAYDDVHKGVGKVEVDSRVLSRSAVKLSLNQAMEDLLKKGQEEIWS